MVLLGAIFICKQGEDIDAHEPVDHSSQSEKIEVLKMGHKRSLSSSFSFFLRLMKNDKIDVTNA